jgi:hypothetical protein
MDIPNANEAKELSLVNKDVIQLKLKKNLSNDVNRDISIAIERGLFSSLTKIDECIEVKHVQNVIDKLQSLGYYAKISMPMKDESSSKLFVSWSNKNGD